MSDLFTEIRDLLKRALLTQGAIPVPMGPKEYGNPLASRLVHAFEDSYGALPAVVRDFNPTPWDVSNYLEILAWLAWFKRSGIYNADKKLEAFMAWAADYPTWKILQRAKRGEDTVRRWRDELVETIVEKFRGDCERIALDYCGKYGASDDYSDTLGTAPALRRSPSFQRSVGAKPIRGAALIGGSSAAIDREKTVKRLERNARKSARRKRMKLLA